MDYVGRSGVSIPYGSAIQIAVEVGDAVAEMRQGLAAQIEQDPLGAEAIADQFAHSAISGLLMKAYPSVPVISEEDAVHQRQRPDRYFLIDPIDGTASWSSGFSGFVSQLALIEFNSPVFGVIHCPLQQRTWTAIRGEGAALNGRALEKLKTSVEAPTLVDNTPEPSGVTQLLMDYLETSSYLESGSIGLKAALVASGEADIFLKRLVVRDWDVAPALVLIHEVGGHVSTPEGHDFVLAGDMEKPSGVLFTRDAHLARMTIDWLVDQRKFQE